MTQIVLNGFGKKQVSWKTFKSISGPNKLSHLMLNVQVLL